MHRGAGDRGLMLLAHSGDQGDQVSTATDGARPWDATVEIPRIDAATVYEQPTTPVADEKPQKAQAVNRLYALDLMRFGAAMLVVAYHYIYAGGRQTWGADTAALFT